MVVTVTNLGSGEVRPQGLLSRVVVGFGSVIGILSTALWVNVFSKYLDLPNEERRILTIVEHQSECPECYKLFISGVLGRYSGVLGRYFSMRLFTMFR